jgi:hypothetical protein
MSAPAHLEPLLTEEDVARLLRRKLRTVQTDRLLNRGPRYIKVGKSVRYRPADIAAFLETCPASAGGATARR